MAFSRECRASVILLLCCCGHMAKSSPFVQARHNTNVGDATTQRDPQDAIEGSGSVGSLDLDLTSLQNFFAIEEATVRPSNQELRARIQSDIDEFMSLMPAAEVRHTIVERFKSNADVQAAIVYLTSSQFAEQLSIVGDDDSVNNFENWLWQADVDLRSVFKRLYKYLGLYKMWELSSTLQIKPTASQNVSHVPTAAMNKLMEDLLALIPQDEVFILFFEKLDSSMVFVKLIETVGNRKFLDSFESLKREKVLEVTATEMYKNRIDICKILDILAKHFLLGMFPSDETVYCPIQRLGIRYDID